MTNHTENTGTTAPKLWVILARAHGALAAFVESRVAALGLCLSDFMVLEVLLHKGPLPISIIGSKVLLANASMTAAVDRLETHGFVRRTHSSEDRRTRIVELTPEGHNFISELYKQHASDLESVFASLGAGERNQLRSSLKTLGLAAQAALKNADPAPSELSTTSAHRKGRTA